MPYAVLGVFRSLGSLSIRCLLAVCSTCVGCVVAVCSGRNLLLSCVGVSVWGQAVCVFGSGVVCTRATALGVPLLRVATKIPPSIVSLGLKFYVGADLVWTFCDPCCVGASLWAQAVCIGAWAWSLVARRPWTHLFCA